MDKEYIRAIVDYMVETKFKEHDTPTPQKMPREEFESALKKLFIGYFDSGYIETYFSVPDDFWNFLEVLKGGLNYNDWEYIYAKSGVISGSEDNLGYVGWSLKRRFEQGEDPKPGDLMFLRIGDWSDKHDYILCCDKSPRGMERYGKVYDAYDDSPWDSDNNYDGEWNDFSDFLHSFYHSGRDEDEGYEEDFLK